MSDTTGADGATHGQHQGADSRESGNPARQDGGQGGGGAGDQLEAQIARVLDRVLPKALNGAVKAHVSRALEGQRKQAAQSDTDGEGEGESRKLDADTADVIKLRRELKELRESVERKEKAAAEKERHARLVSALSEAEAVNPEKVARVLSAELKVDENGNWFGEDESGTPLTLGDAIGAFLKANPWAKKPVKGAPGGGSIGDAKHGGNGLPANATPTQKLEFALANRK